MSHLHVTQTTHLVSNNEWALLMQKTRESFVVTSQLLDELESRSVNAMGILGIWRLKYHVCAVVACAAATAVAGKPVIPIIGLVLSFVVDYLAYRRRRRFRLASEVALLRRFVGQDLSAKFYENDTAGSYETSTIADFGKRKVSEVNPIHYARRLVVEYVCKRGLFSGMRLLDIGCNYGILTEAFRGSWAEIIGTDLQTFNLDEYKRRLNSTPVVADANHFPFKKGFVDGVSFMEIIEHLTNPFDILQEIGETMSPNGRLLLTTNNRHELLWEYLLNPLIVLEKIVGLAFDGVLPVRPIIWRGFEDKLFYYHTAYSKREITAILRECGFRISYIASFPPLVNAYRLLNIVGIDPTESEFARFQLFLSKILMRLPILRYLGGHWMIVAEREQKAAGPS